MGYRVFLDSFSGDLAELKRGKRTPENALAVLNKSPMVSTWDMSENKWLYMLISDLKHEGLIVEQEQPYPWHRYKLPDAGKARLPSNAELCGGEAVRTSAGLAGAVDTEE